MEGTVSNTVKSTSLVNTRLHTQILSLVVLYKLLNFNVTSKFLCVPCLVLQACLTVLISIQVHGLNMYLLVLDINFTLKPTDSFASRCIWCSLGPQIN